MPFDWRDYLRLADELSPRVADEAALRSAISRAYYAVFGAAREVLQREGVGLASLSIHEAVWTAFRSHPHRHRKNIGNQGDRLREYRVRADYQSTFRDLQPSAAVAVALARSVLTQLDALEGP